MWISYDKDKIIRVMSSYPIISKGQIVKEVGMPYSENIIGSKLEELQNIKDTNSLKLAFVSNWNEKCGISTYSQKLCKEIIPKIKEIRVFAESTKDNLEEDENFVSRCWTRGSSLIGLAKEIKAWNPDFIIIQHEFGLFPSGSNFMQFIEHLDSIPYAVVLHSTYEHLDKSVYINCIRNIIVHTQESKKILENMDCSANIFVIPHGCDHIEETSELWNILQRPYSVMQFGFGFDYKGVEIALQAIAHLKNSDPKFRDIFYFYLCSTNSHNQARHIDYYTKLKTIIKDLDIEENVSIIPKYQTANMINLYLRLAKISVFPYVTNENNKVYGSSGAIRVAMSNKRPVIASKSHLFDDLEGIVPRIKDHIDLAKEIDEIFSNDVYRQTLIEDISSYVKNNSWERSAEKYISVYKQLL